MGDVRDYLVGPPYRTTPATVTANKNSRVHVSSIRSSEIIQKKEDGPDCTVSNNKFSSVTLNDLTQRKHAVFSSCNKAVNLKVKSMQRSGTEAIRTQLQPSKPKREITNITNCQNTKRIYGQPSEQLFPKRWSFRNRNRTKKNMNTREVKRHRNSDTKTGTCNRDPQQNYRLGTVSIELLGA